jgi:hypothetical protein
VDRGAEDEGRGSEFFKKIKALAENEISIKMKAFRTDRVMHACKMHP